MKLDKKSRENWKLAGIMLVSGLLFGFFVEEGEDL